MSYSEASHLATPDIINESIQITQHSLQEYRKLRKSDKIEDMSNNLDVQERMFELIDSAKTIISGIERYVDNPNSAEGFYKIFASGFLPVPYLWGEVDEFKYAKHLKTKPVKVGIKVVDNNNNPIKTDKIVEYATENIKEVEYILGQKKIIVK